MATFQTIYKRQVRPRIEFTGEDAWGDPIDLYYTVNEDLWIDEDYIDLPFLLDMIETVEIPDEMKKYREERKLNLEEERFVNCGLFKIE